MAEAAEKCSMIRLLVHVYMQYIGFIIAGLNGSSTVAQAIPHQSVDSVLAMEPPLAIQQLEGEAYGGRGR